MENDTDSLMTLSPVGARHGDVTKALVPQLSGNALKETAHSHYNTLTKNKKKPCSELSPYRDSRMLFVIGIQFFLLVQEGSHCKRHASWLHSFSGVI